MPIFPITPNAPPNHLAQLDELAQATFGIRFEAWRSAGWWTNDYIVYGWFDSDRLLACAGAYRMDLRVHGRPVQAIQIGTVATRSEARGRGLSRQVLEHLLAQYPGAPSFLCANHSVLDFYPRFGYRKVAVQEMAVPLDLPSGDQQRLPTLLPAHQAIQRQSLTRPAFSACFDCANAAPVAAFHLLLEPELRVHEIEALSARIVTQQEGSSLHLLDVIVQQPLAFTQLAPYLAFPNQEGAPTVRTVRLGFNADWLGLAAPWQPPAEDPHLFVRGSLDLPEPLTLPDLLIT